MPTIKPFPGYLVNPEHATDVVSPAYDAVSPEERRNFAAENPNNFLNTMRLLDDFEEDSRPTVDELLDMNRAKLDELLSNGSFERLDNPCLYIYQLTSGEHSQTGVVCEVSVDEYESGHLRKHENTRSDKEDLLAQYQKVVGVSSSPICLTYSADEAINSLLTTETNKPPHLDFFSEDGVNQKVWCIDDAERQQTFITLFQNIPVSYLTDGHHRAASGTRYAKMMRPEKGNEGHEPHNQLLVALFSDEQLNLLPFHRCVKDLNGQSEQDVVDALAENFIVEAQSESYTPTQHGQFGMLINDNWYRLEIKDNVVSSDNPVDLLDVSILQDYILDPILGIKDMRSDSRLGYVAGVSGNDGLVSQCHDGWAVAFSCFATSIEQLMDVADAGELMPPKSTYFDPKARSGVFVRRK